MRSRFIPICAAVAAFAVLTVGHTQPTKEKAVSDDAKRAMIKRDYEALTGRWQLVKSIVDGKEVPASEVRKTVLITDHNVFRFPADAGVGTAPQGEFTIDPTTTPKQVDSTGEAGANKGKVTKGIYEIIDANNKRACWGQPGGPRPTDFTSAAGSGRTVQYWRLISKELGK